MAREREIGRQAFGRRPRDDGEAFARALKRRGEAARGLETDLLTKVPLLYGDPDGRDSGIVLHRLHQEELVGRNGGGAPPGARRRSGNALPFEGATALLAILLALLCFFMG